MRLILAPPESSTVLISDPDPSMHFSKSVLNELIILKIDGIKQKKLSYHITNIQPIIYFNVHIKIFGYNNYPV